MIALWRFWGDGLFQLLGFGIIFGGRFGFLFRVLRCILDIILRVFDLSVILDELGVTERDGSQVVFWLPFHWTILEGCLEEVKEGRRNIRLEPE